MLTGRDVPFGRTDPLDRDKSSRPAGGMTQTADATALQLLMLTRVPAECPASLPHVHMPALKYLRP